MSNLSSNRFFSKDDRRKAQRWEPDALGLGLHRSSVEQKETASAEVDRNNAREDGFRAGYAAGESAVRAAVERLARVAAAAEQGLGGQDHLIAEGLLELALSIARQIVRTDIKVKREHVLKVVREAMDCLPQSTTRAQLLVHPSDVDLVRSHVGEELAFGSWPIVEDHRIEPGGCRIISPTCEIDATLATRWKRVVASLGSEQSWIESET